MARPLRAAFVTLLAGVTCTGLVTGAQAAAGSSQAAPAVLAPAKAEGVAPTTAGLTKALAPILSHPSMGKHRGAYVYDASRGKPVLAAGTATPFVPASTLKLLTTVAALETIGADKTFATKTVSATKGTLVLVGGGDPLLTVKPSGGPSVYPTRATLQDLATATAKALRAQKLTAVRLGYDATLFPGAGGNPKWEPKYLPEGIAARTSALWVNAGRVAPGMARRVEDPAQAAAAVFAKQLQLAGIKVTGAVRPGKAPAGAEPLAQVLSPTVGQLVEHVNLHSDNDAAEVLLRQVGVATGNGGSIAGGIKGLRAALTKLGLDVSKARIEDGSGLSRTNLVPLDLIAGAVRVAVGQERLRYLLSGLPVAGFTGSLENRFAGTGAAPGTGLVRAKTGTLTGVHSLAGLVRTRTGTLLVFAINTDSNPPPLTLEARAALDRATAALAACGCSS